MRVDKYHKLSYDETLICANKRDDFLKSQDVDDDCWKFSREKRYVYLINDFPIQHLSFAQHLPVICLEKCGKVSS